MTSATKHTIFAVAGFMFGASGVRAGTTARADLEEAPRPDALPDDSIDSGPAPQAANSNDDLPTCEWETNTVSNSTTTFALCASTDKKPIAGSCACSGTEDLKASVPVENVTVFSYDPPDNGESWYATDGTTGWFCEYQSACTSVIAHALCCGS